MSMTSGVTNGAPCNVLNDPNGSVAESSSLAIHELPVPAPNLNLTPLVDCVDAMSVSEGPDTVD